MQFGSTIFCSIIHRNTKSHYKNEFVPIFFLHSCVAYDSFLCWNFCSEELSFFLESWIFFFMSILLTVPSTLLLSSVFCTFTAHTYLFERIECSIATICFFGTKRTQDGVLNVKCSHFHNEFGGTFWTGDFSGTENGIDFGFLMLKYERKMGISSWKSKFY